MLTQPFEEPFANTWEVFNESCVILVTYCLIVLQNVQLSPDQRINAGYVQIFVYCLNMFFNLSKILRKMYFQSIPEAYNRYKQKQQDKLHAEKYQSWLSSKVEFCKNNPTLPFVNEIQIAVDLMSKLIPLKKEVLKQHQEIEEEHRWLHAQGLDL